MPSPNPIQIQSIQNDLPKYEDLNNDQIVSNRLTNWFRSTPNVLPNNVHIEIFGNEPPKYCEIDKRMLNV
jgi:hypothetical protein